MNLEKDYFDEFLINFMKQNVNFSVDNNSMIVILERINYNLKDYN